MATFNGAATLPQVLAAHAALAPPAGGWRLYVVDDGSTDETPDILGAWQDRLPLHILRQPRRGKSAALNLAVECLLAEEGSELFVFTDDDALPAPDWLREWAACARACRDYAVFGGTIVPAWSAAPPPWILRQAPLGLTYGLTACQDGPVFPGLVWGANMAVRRCVFAAGHRFDPRIGPGAAGRQAYAMGSETEFTRRVCAQGAQAWFCTAARVAHVIRPHQLTRAWILERARHYGRGTRCQEQRDTAPRLFGVPRWMFARYALETLAQARSVLAHDRAGAFAHAWERAQIEGYLAQAWTGPRRKRIVFTGCSGALGGMEWRLAQEAATLAHSGYACLLALPRFPGHARLAVAAAAQGVPLRRMVAPEFLEQWRWRRARRAAAALAGTASLRRLRPDLVHVAFCWTAYGASRVWLAQRCGVPCVVSVHNAFPPAQFTPWQERQVAAAFAAVRGVIAVSGSALAHFMATYARHLPAAVRCAVIPNAVDSQRFLPCPIRRRGARARFGIPQDALVLGSVARLAPQKRLDRVLQLAAALRGRYPNLHVLLIGAGPLAADLRTLALRLGVADTVHFAGHVDAVEDLLPALDLHLLLSRNEGFGIATIEAMSCGVPAVATDVPGNADVLADSAGGLLVPADEPAVLEEAVAALLDDPLRRLWMGRCGRAEVQARYAPALMARRLREFYAGVLA
jgi:glycosyltransferase involved in cell wall biosynthesis